MTVDDLRYAGSQPGCAAGHAHAARSRRRVLAGVRGRRRRTSSPRKGRAQARTRAAASSSPPTREHLAALLRGVELPAEWPTETLRAAGELAWPADSQGDLTRVLAGQFDLETAGTRQQSSARLASATLADGQIELANVQGTGPEADQVFRGSGRVALLAREYDLTVDYEQVSLAASAVPTPARARLARAWTALRGSAARRGWAEAARSAPRAVARHLGTGALKPSLK